MSNDTIELLKKCNSGIKMGVNTIDECLDKVDSSEFYRLLSDCKEKHQTLGSETHELLDNCGETGKNPSPAARGMSWIKTNVMLSVNNNDRTVADLITDGCNMGVKSLNRYLNKYEFAEDRAKDIAKRLINLESGLAEDIRKYL